MLFVVSLIFPKKEVNIPKPSGYEKSIADYCQMSEVYRICVSKYFRPNYCHPGEGLG